MIDGLPAFGIAIIVMASCMAAQWDWPVTASHTEVDASRSGLKLNDSGSCLEGRADVRMTDLELIGHQIERY